MTSPWLIDADVGATGHTYEIRTVADFLKVPEARRRICLREFHSWMVMQEGVTEILTAASDSQGGDLRAEDLRWSNDVFAWIDDGKALISVEMVTTNKTLP